MKKLIIIFLLLFSSLLYSNTNTIVTNETPTFQNQLTKEDIKLLRVEFDFLLLNQGLTNSLFRDALVDNLVRLAIIEKNKYEIKLPQFNIFIDDMSRFIYLSYPTNSIINVSVQDPESGNNALNLKFKVSDSVKYAIRNKSTFGSRFKVFPHFFYYDEKFDQDFSFSFKFFEIDKIGFNFGLGFSGFDFSINYYIFNLGIKYLYKEQKLSPIFGISISLFK